MHLSKFIFGLFLMQVAKDGVVKAPPAIPTDLLFKAERSAKHMLAVQQEREQILQQIQAFCAKDGFVLSSKGEDLVCENKPAEPKK